MQAVIMYRQNAQACRDLAKQARDEVERATLLRMAETWSALASNRLAIQGTGENEIPRCHGAQRGNEGARPGS